MASAFTHAATGALLCAALVPPPRRSRLWAAAILLPPLPDLDVIAFRFGIAYEHPLGHRGFSHSLLCALLLGLCVAWLLFRREPARQRLRLGLFLALATASHGVLDAMTNGGEGIGFLIPFCNQRWFLPWRPIEVSPLSAAAFFSARGADILVNELQVVILPLLALTLACVAVRRGRGK